MNPSPHFRFAKGFSSAVLIGIVLACGYTLGKSISSAEAAVGDVAADGGSDQPKPIPDSGSSRQVSAKSNPEAPLGGASAAASESGPASVRDKVDADASRGDRATSGVMFPGPKPDKMDRDSGGSVAGDVALGDVVPAADLLEFNATAYCLAGNSAAGIATQRGMIAADPRILPLGSVVHIRAGDYSGTYLVLDTGAKIKGNKIDIYMPDRHEAMSFGRRSVRLKVIGRVRPNHLQPK